mmetsp:Transcript_22562/g.54299  ORF Transcript_22562/g.54299 Transcript_22562/m.54299 type:complete len:84 (-) Transcript_22562:504-755(-)
MFGQNPLSGSIIGADYHLQATSILIIDHPFQTERFFRKGLLMGLLQEVYDPLVTHFDCFLHLVETPFLLLLLLLLLLLQLRER